MSDYFMSHEYKQRINDLQHLREQMRQSEGLTERRERIQWRLVRPAGLVKAMQMILNAVAHRKSFSTVAGRPI